ncbi:hypothetical protein ACLOJK_029880 [Asimina triloba]
MASCEWDGRQARRGRDGEIAVEALSPSLPLSFFISLPLEAACTSISSSSSAAHSRRVRLSRYHCGSISSSNWNYTGKTLNASLSKFILARRVQLACSTRKSRWKSIGGCMRGHLNPLKSKNLDQRREGRLFATVEGFANIRNSNLLENCNYYVADGNEDLRTVSEREDSTIIVPSLPDDSDGNHSSPISSCFWDWKPKFTVHYEKSGISDPVSIREVLKQVYADHSTKVDKVFSRILETTQHPAAAASFASIMFAPKGPLSFHEALSRYLQNLVPLCKVNNVPICLMYGKEDPWVRPVWGLKVKQEVPEAPYYEISPAGHCPHDEVPENIVYYDRRESKSSEGFGEGFLEDLNNSYNGTSLKVVTVDNALTTPSGRASAADEENRTPKTMPIMTPSTPSTISISMQTSHTPSPVSVLFGTAAEEESEEIEYSFEEKGAGFIVPKSYPKTVHV